MESRDTGETTGLRSRSRLMCPRVGSVVVAVALLWPFGVVAQEEGSPDAASLPAPTLVCASQPGQRTHCPADTSSGVLLYRSATPEACLLGRTWGYDAEGVWVSDGCSAEFLVGPAAQAPDAQQPSVQPPPADEPIERWGEFEAGDGFLVGRGKGGELSISAYALVRYINQTPAEQTFTDHLGNEHTVDGRADVAPHRAIIWLKGWVANPKLQYMLLVWTVNATDQDALFGNIGYQFDRKFSLYAGLNGNPGTRSLQGSHPYWLGNDRVMADEFFRPYFTFGLTAQGEPTRGFWYNAMIGNNSSALGIKAAQLDRRPTYSGSVWWMPTTKEFGPRGGYGDWEYHESLATRFGISATYSPEERFTDSTTGAAGNTTIKLADSLNVFDTGALAPDVTVDRVNYTMVAVDAGLKYRGFFLQAEYFNRRLDDFEADGSLPVDSIQDSGFYVQAAFFPIRKLLEVYAITSQIYGDKDAGFGNSSEYIVGTNVYPFDSRNYRFNLQVMDVNRSPVGSTFGYYTAGQDGTTVAAAFSVLF